MTSEFRASLKFKPRESTLFLPRQDTNSIRDHSLVRCEMSLVTVQVNLGKHNISYLPENRGEPWRHGDFTGQQREDHAKHRSKIGPARVFLISSQTSKGNLLKPQNTFETQLMERLEEENVNY